MTQIIRTDSLDWMQYATDASVDLILGSPPYALKMNRYGSDEFRDSFIHPNKVGNELKADMWKEWMAALTVEACRVSKNWVVWVVNSPYRDGCYIPACESLLVTCHERYGIQCERPLIWRKNAPPNRKNWFANNWEYILAFRCDDGKTEHFDWESIAEPPKFKSGGDFRQRDSNGVRRNGNSYPKGKLTRPKDVLRVTVGGGHMGSKLAHENEAPYPEKLVEPLIKALCPADGVVLDPFCGSGTTLKVAERLGRTAIGLDIRESQIELSRKRVLENELNGRTQRT